jgi:hypothetical protein
MLIKHLPNSIRDKAITYWLKYRDLYNLSITEKEIDAAYNTNLVDAFIWKKTDEGKPYWELCNYGQFERAEEYLENLQKSKTKYMMDGKPIYMEAMPTIKEPAIKHRLKPFKRMGPTERILLAFLIASNLLAGIFTIYSFIKN